MSVSKTLNQRKKTHGNFAEHAKISQDLKDIMRPHFDNLSSAQKEALDMIQHKIARILNGNPNYADHWHDIAGYAQLVEKDCDK